MGKSKSYKQHLIERLQTPEDVAGYVNAAMEEGDMATLLLALRDVADAQGMGKVATESELNRQNVYRMLSADGNPRLESLLSVLHVLRLDMRFEPIRDTDSSVATVSPTLVGSQDEPEQFRAVPDRDRGMDYESDIQTNKLTIAA